MGWLDWTGWWKGELPRDLSPGTLGLHNSHRILARVILQNLSELWLYLEGFLASFYLKGASPPFNT